MFSLKKENGFTIVEIILTIVIVGILAASMVSRFVDLSSSADASACKANQMSLETAQRLYYVKTLQEHNGQFAQSLEDLTPYLRNESIPECPSGGEYLIIPGGEITCTIGDH